MPRPKVWVARGQPGERMIPPSLSSKVRDCIIPTYLKQSKNHPRSFLKFFSHISTFQNPEISKKWKVRGINISIFLMGGIQQWEFGSCDIFMSVDFTWGACLSYDRLFHQLFQLFARVPWIQSNCSRSDAAAGRDRFEKMEVFCAAERLTTVRSKYLDLRTSLPRGPFCESLGLVII